MKKLRLYINILFGLDTNKWKVDWNVEEKEHICIKNFGLVENWMKLKRPKMHDEICISYRVNEKGDYNSWSKEPETLLKCEYKEGKQEKEKLE